MAGSEEVTQAQLTSLDDTDCYASVWEQILERQRDGKASNSTLWGGKGKGGRGLARRTIQPHDIVVDDVRLQYLLGDICLEGATIKLLHNHIYCLVGRNGCGKSTLLKKMHSQRIPGWSIQWSSLYIPPNFPLEYLSLTPTQVVSKYFEECKRNSRLAIVARISELEARMDCIDIEQEQDEMESLCEELSELEDELTFDDSSFKQEEMDLFEDLRIDVEKFCNELPPIQQKEILLCTASICSRFTNLILLDEPTNNLDVDGLIRLRQMIKDNFARSTTVVMVSHDVDLINDVATDIIVMCAKKLRYFPGNYDSYQLIMSQKEAHFIKKNQAMQKKCGQLQTTLQNLKEMPTPKRRGGAKKKAKAVSSHRKKIERHQESMKSLDSTSEVPTERKGLTIAQRVKLAEVTKSVPDKAVQFVLPKVTSQWGEPLITAYDVGYGTKDEIVETNAHLSKLKCTDFDITKRDGFLFDCVDMCIEEGSRTCILGPGISTSYLMKILAKRLAPIEGTVHHSSGLSIGYCDYREIEKSISIVDQTTTAVEYLLRMHPKKLEKDLRSFLTAFGLSSKSQTVTPLAYLSGGETFRLILAKVMMNNPSVLCLEHPTSHLDVESVQALSFGLRQWNGTVIMTCQDASFLRSLKNVRYMVVVPEEGKVRRIVDDGRCNMQGMDTYLSSLYSS